MTIPLLHQAIDAPEMPMSPRAFEFCLPINVV
jgi:hypothetical protein